MFVGPVFDRELSVAPRRTRHYVTRAAYAGALFVLLSAAYMLSVGQQAVPGVGDMARFGTHLFQIFAPLQLVLALFFSAILAAGAVAQEKDRKTLVLLLLTNLTNSELVLGKLLATLLNVGVMLAAGLPVFCISLLFGGLSLSQVGWSLAVTAASALAAGSLGSTIALWREKTFQTIAVTSLVLVVWVVAWEVPASGAIQGTFASLRANDWATLMSPWRAALAAASPDSTEPLSLAGLTFEPVVGFLAAAALGGIVLNGLAIGLVRVWNPGREGRARKDEVIEREGIESLSETGPAPRADRPAHVDRKKTRQVWDNPILWREVRTHAYGRRTLAIKAIYVLLFLLVAAGVWFLAQQDRGLEGQNAALAMVPLFVLSMVLINAQAVTSITNERDGKALDLLLVSDITPREFIFGKLGGVLYNTKEMVILPMLLCGYLWRERVLGAENLVYLLSGLLVMVAFSAMLGVHAGMAYFNSRLAIATSLGTVFFLFVGVFTCMQIMVAFSGSFQVQLGPFLAIIMGGWAGLFVALGVRNPSPAIGLASLACPVATFYAITSFLLGMPLAVFSTIVLAYGFATAAMLVPAISEFDVATGRTTGGEE